MTTTKQLAQTIKEAADRLVAQEQALNSHTKAGSVAAIVKTMAEKGYISEDLIEEKKAELMNEPDLDVYSRALSAIGGKPVEIASPEKKAGAGDPLDNWLFGN